MQTQITTLHRSFLYTMFQLFLFVWFSTSTCCKKQDLSFVFLKLLCRKKIKHAISFLFFPPPQRLPPLCCAECCSQPRCPLVPKRRQLPAPGKGCDPRLHRLAPLPSSKAEVDGFCTSQTQFLSLCQKPST